MDGAILYFFYTLSDVLVLSVYIVSVSCAIMGLSPLTIVGGLGFAITIWRDPRAHYTARWKRLSIILCVLSVYNITCLYPK